MRPRRASPATAALALDAVLDEGEHLLRLAHRHPGAAEDKLGGGSAKQAAAQVQLPIIPRSRYVNVLFMRRRRRRLRRFRHVHVTITVSPPQVQVLLMHTGGR